MFSAACLFVCLFVRMITSKRLTYDDETWQLDALYKNLATVRMSRSMVKGQGHLGQKNEKNAESSPLTMHGKSHIPLRYPGRRTGMRPE